MRRELWRGKGGTRQGLQKGLTYSRSSLNQENIQMQLEERVFKELQVLLSLPEQNEN